MTRHQHQPQPIAAETIGNCPGIENSHSGIEDVEASPEDTDGSPPSVVYNVARNISARYRDESDSPDHYSNESPDSMELSRSAEGFSQSGTARRSRLWPSIPLPIQEASKAVANWTRGPIPTRPWAITPFFPKVQKAPIRLLHRYLPRPRKRVYLLLAFYLSWLLCFVTVLNKSANVGKITGYGEPALLTCTDTFWQRKNSCGLDGVDCLPFTNKSMAFRCPASCLLVLVLEPHAVGTTEVNYKPLVIGGPTDSKNSIDSAIYRGDSFICASAIHSGYINNAAGGCGVVDLVGQAEDYPSIRQHGITSTSFDSSFPLSFKFLQDSRITCKDLRWPILAITVVFSSLLSIFTTSPAVFFTSIYIGLYFQIALVSDPPSGADYYDLVSQALAGFLPASFVMYVMYRFCIKKTLSGLNAQFEKTILWLGPCWVGALNSYTFDLIPLSRLTPHDLAQEPGAITSLIIIVSALIIIAVGQAWALRVEGLMPRYLAVYAILSITLIVFLLIPHLHLRIHHYILALLLLPGTAIQTRPSLVYQGLLVGFFINGVARWGFSPILETSAGLLGNAQLGSALPAIAAPIVALSSITFYWGFVASGFDGISILVNDVERYRAYGNQTVNWTYHRENGNSHPEYFRFGYMSGSSSQDYTMAGVWEANGNWTKMEPGPS